MSRTCPYCYSALSRDIAGWYCENCYQQGLKAMDDAESEAVQGGDDE